MPHLALLGPGMMIMDKRKEAITRVIRRKEGLVVVDGKWVGAGELLVLYL